MKKILLASAFFAVASLNSFGAALGDCTTLSLTLAGLSGNSCTVNGWTLDTWGFGSGGASQTGYSAAPTLADIQVTIATATNGNGALGFSVRFSDAAGGENFFSATSGSPNDTVNWKTIFVVTGAPIAQVANYVDGATTTVGNNGSIVLQKIITNAGAQGNPTITDGTILTISGAQSTNPLTLVNNQSSTVTSMGVIDNYQLNSGNNGSASLSYYSNTFLGIDPPPTGIPEPMTFVLMGAGLVGIAALRRRNS